MKPSTDGCTERGTESPLPGTKAKQARALAHNLEFMCREFGLETIGFLTLTVGDYGPDGRWLGVHDRAEASRRFNSILNRIRERYRCGAIVTERHKSGAIHFHLLVATGFDLRTGLDVEAVKRRDYRSASAALRAEWQWWRDIQGKYGFGRHELLPVKTTAQQVARYVAKYLSKSWNERRAEDKGGRCLRYFGRWSKAGLKVGPPMSARHGSMTERAQAWRACCRQIQMATRFLGVELNEQNIKEYNGPRWAWRLTKQIQRFTFFLPARSSAAERCGLAAHNEEAACASSAHVGESKLDNWFQGVVEEGDDYVVTKWRLFNYWLEERRRDWEHCWNAVMQWVEMTEELEHAVN